MPCGQGQHVVRWEAGGIRLASHADTEAELVLAALGGEKVKCVEVAQAWGRHTEDLTVLSIGPREETDVITVSWDDVAAATQAGPYGRPRTGPMRLAGVPQALARGGVRHQQMQDEMEQVRQRRLDLLSLLALGYGFQVRLIGQVAAAHEDRLADEERARKIRPALAAALAGRLMPVVEDWLGIDADQVVASLHTGPGWGSVELTGRGEQRRLRVSLPAGWLARVWACGLTLIGRHLVVAVDRAGWPDARVLALRAPGTEPVLLDVHAREGGDGQPGVPDGPHWEI